MKTTAQVSLFLSFFFFSLCAFAQQIPPLVLEADLSTSNQPEVQPSEMLISYLEGTAENIKQQVRERYDITNYQDINGELEIWLDIDFPLDVTDEDGQIIQLHDVGELIADIDNQNGVTGDHSDARSQVNGGDFNYSLVLPREGGSEYNGVLMLLPDCRPEDYRLVGSLGAHVPSTTQVVIMDQMFGLNNPNHEAGIATHADKVSHVISLTTRIAGMDVDFINVPVFDQYGESTYARIIQGFKWLEDNNITDCVVNFSANMLVYDNNFSVPVRDYINDVLINNNLLLISSAGNNGLANNVSVFPGGGFFNNEITVAGTESCFTAPWSNTNQNFHHFEIAAEAEGVVVPGSNNSWKLDKGTSYSAPMVSSAIIQLATHYATFDPATLKMRLLQEADQVPALSTTTQLGRVLNATAATNFTSLLQQDGFGSTINTGNTAEQMEVYPNPFQNELNLTLPAEFQADTPVRINVFNQLGQTVFTQTISPAGRSIQLFDPQLSDQPTGVYWLQLSDNNQQRTLMINKM